MQARKSRALVAQDNLVDRELQVTEAILYQTDLAISLPYKGPLLALILQRASVRNLGHRQRVRDLLSYYDLQRDLVRDKIVLLVLEITACAKMSTTDVDCQMSIRLQVDLLLESQQALPLHGLSYALRSLLAASALVRSEKGEHVRISVVENLELLHKGLNKLQILYEQLPNKKEQIAINQLDLVAAQVSLVIASYEDYYLVLHVHVFLLVRRDIAMSYGEQLDNAGGLTPRQMHKQQQLSAKDDYRSQIDLYALRRPDPARALESEDRTEGDRLLRELLQSDIAVKRSARASIL